MPDTVVDTAHREGTTINEDLLTITDSAAWVLDGTSGVTDRQLIGDAVTDGRWYVETFDEYLRDAVTDTTRSLEQIVYDGIEQMAFALDDAMTIDRADTPSTADPTQAVSVLDIPAATIAIVRWDGSNLEYLSLGDSVVLVRTDDGTVHRHFHGDPEQFDAANRKRMAEIRDDHPDASYRALRGFLHHRIEQTRCLRETPGGYWALGVNPVAARYAETGQHRLDAIEDTYLFTDGFDPLVELYDAFGSWKEATDFIRENDVDAAVDRLREIETADADLTEYPRLKPHDDIAVIRISFDPDDTTDT